MTQQLLDELFGENQCMVEADEMAHDEAREDAQAQAQAQADADVDVDDDEDAAADAEGGRDADTSSLFVSPSVKRQKVEQSMRQSRISVGTPHGTSYVYRRLPSLKSIRQSCVRTRYIRPILLPATLSQTPPHTLRGLEVDSLHWTRTSNGFRIRVVCDSTNSVVRDICPYDASGDNASNFDFIKDMLDLPSAKSLPWIDDKGGHWLAGRDMSTFVDMESLLLSSALCAFCDDQRLMRNIWTVLLFRFIILGSGEQTQCSNVHIDLQTRTATSIEDWHRHRIYTHEIGGALSIQKDALSRKSEGAAQLMSRDSPIEFAHMMNESFNRTHICRLLDRWKETIVHKCKTQYTHGIVPRIDFLRNTFVVPPVLGSP